MTTMMPCKDIEKHRQYSREYYHRNKHKSQERARRRTRRYREAHRELLRAQSREYYRNNPDKFREYARKNFPEFYTRGDKIIQKAKDTPCADCNRRFPYYVMDFDHIKGEKVHCVGVMRAWRVDKLLAEIAKCEVVCSNCHRIRTFTRHKVTVVDVDDEE